MKNLIKVLTMVMLLVSVQNTYAQDRQVTFAELPKQAQQFLKEHFSAQNVSYVIQETESFFKKSYDVVLKNGSKIEFDPKGLWTEIDTKLNAVPSILVPKSIKEYVKRSFPDNKIVQISRSKSKYEVELTNGIDLEFNRKGEFLRIDD